MSRTTHKPESHPDIRVESRGVYDETPEEVDVLHVDDSSEFVEMAEMYLEKNNDNLNVETKTDPVEALERLDEEEFDCVVSDCSMPGMEMDGVELHQKVRSEYPNLSFVFFTGTPISEFPEEVIADEDTGHMTKEIDVKQFSNLAGWIVETVE